MKKNGNGKKAEKAGVSLSTYGRLGAAIAAFEAGKLPRGTKLVENEDGEYLLVGPVKGGLPHVFIQVGRGDLVRFLLKRCQIKMNVSRA